ncbi:MAG: PfkB family carbohydrate kinase [Defluviitaleaceae bacterium]|nr:PfkB family carbohydrate kinase [Defluviitaleaceae bacterium]
MTTDRLAQIFSGIGQKKIAVAGDFFLDEYLHIDPALDEPSIETGLTAYQVVSRAVSPGAAGTVAKNLAVLGVGSVYAVSVIGGDGRGFELSGALKKLGVDTECLISAPSRATPTYTKPMYGENPPRELNRLDVKNFSPTPAHIEDEIISNIKKAAAHADALIIMDQVSEKDRGVVTERVRDFLIGLAKIMPGLIMIADSRSRIGSFANMIVKGNEREIPDAEETSRRLGNKPFFITLGEKGALAYENGRAVTIPPFEVKGPTDICGAGDAFTAGAAAALCCGASVCEAAAAGCLLASICVAQIGTTGQATADEMISKHKKIYSGGYQ